jgi:tetratricopeptide (TPR) repeat protein
MNIRKPDRQLRQGLLTLAGSLGLMLLIGGISYLSLHSASPPAAGQSVAQNASESSDPSLHPQAADGKPGRPDGQTGNAASEAMPAAAAMNQPADGKAPHDSAASQGNGDIDSFSASLVAEKDNPEIRQLESQIEIEPQNSELLSKLGNAYFDQHNYPKAIDAYYRALQQHGQDPDLLTDAGTAYFYLGMSHIALDHYQRALAADPNHVRALFNQGILHATEHRPAQARPALIKARSLLKANDPLAAKIDEMLKSLDKKPSDQHP